jgi:hypothetical protein
MQTYFAQVEDNEIQRAAIEAADRVSAAYAEEQEPSEADAEACERDSIIYWIGADSIGQVPTVEELALNLAPYAVIEPEMMETLRSDRLGAERRPRNGHERATQDYVRAHTPPTVSEAAQ